MRNPATRPTHVFVEEFLGTHGLVSQGQSKHASKVLLLRAWQKHVVVRFIDYIRFFVLLGGLEAPVLGPPTESQSLAGTVFDILIISYYLSENFETI